MESSTIEMNIDHKLMKQSLFIYSAIQNGWTVRKKANLFIFNKKHEGNKKYFDEEYLSTFMKETSNINHLIKELL